MSLTSTPIDFTVGEIRRMGDTVADLAAQLQLVLADFQRVDAWPAPENRKRGWNGKYGIRCAGCGRWAVVLGGNDGYNPDTGEYDPWWDVECSRCGNMEGMAPE